MNCKKCNTKLTQKVEEYCEANNKEYLCYECQRNPKRNENKNGNLSIKILKESKRFKLESLYNDFKNTDVLIKATQSQAIFNPKTSEMNYILVCYYE